MLSIKLPYLGSNAIVEEIETPMGYTEINGIELYNNASIRNNVIVRVDLLRYLNEYFTDYTISKERDILYYILSGKGYNNMKDGINEFLSKTYQEDEVFKVKLAKIFYFRGFNLENLSVYHALLEDVKISINKIRNDVQKLLDEKRLSNKLIVEHKLYAYYSISNYTFDLNKLNSIPGLEVVSRC